MKKIAKIIAIATLVTFIAGFISSCRSSSACPAYGETSKYQIETRY